MPSTPLSAFRRLRNDSPVVLPKSPVLTPVRTISFIPFAAISRACLSSSQTGMFLLRPLANGTVQYAQKLSHPSCTFRNERVRSPEE